MPDIVQVTVKTKTMDLFRFMFFHAYSKFSGVLTLIAAIASVITLPISIFVWKDTFTTAALGIIVVMYLILTPLNMLSQSRRQVLANPVFKNPITYHISEEIFEVQQYTGTIRFYWSQLAKVRQTPFDYLFYVNTEQAFILPKKIIDPEEIQILEKILETVKDEVAKTAQPIEKEQTTVSKAGADIENDNLDLAVGDDKVIDNEEVDEIQKNNEDNVGNANEDKPTKANGQNSANVDKSNKKKKKYRGKKKKTDQLERQLMEMASRDTEPLVEDSENQKQ